MADYNNRNINSDRTGPSNHEDACNGFDCTRAIELNPDYQNIYQRGWLYVSKGEYDRSIADFTKLVKDERKGDFGVDSFFLFLGWPGFSASS